MIDPTKQLNEDMFEKEVEQVPLRNGFGEGLVEAADADERVVGLCADLTDSTRMKAFADKYSERFVEIGVAEQNLAATGSGMAAMGKVVFVSSYAMFSPGRNWEQIRTTICYNDQKVVVVGSHAGISVGPDGGTHQAIEDMAITRVIPRMQVVAPCDTHEARKATRTLAINEGPAYLRLAREKTPVMTTEGTPFEIGKAYEMWRSPNPQVALIGAGPLLHNALLAAQQLQERGIGSVVLNSHTVKPLDEAKIIELARETGAVVSIEEHQRKGGLGSAIAETLVQHAPTKMEFIGVNDMFGQSGKPLELVEHYEMGVSHIVAASERVLGRS